MPVATLAGRRKAGDDDVGTKLSIEPDRVTKDVLFPPDRERLLGTLRVAEVDRAGEELPRAVDPPRRQELLRPQETDELALLLSYEVLPAVASGEGQVRRLDEPAPGQRGEERRVLVVGMRADVERTAHHLELLELQLDLGGIRSLRGLGDRARGRRNEREEHEEREGARGAIGVPLSFSRLDGDKIASFVRPDGYASGSSRPQQRLSCCCCRARAS